MPAHAGGRRPFVSNNYIIEVGSQPAGIVVQDGNSYRFFAAAPAFFALEGQTFRTPRDAQSAADRTAEGLGNTPRRKQGRL
jgi:hypothetical protein